MLKALFPKGRIVADFEAVQRHRRWIRTGRPLSLLFRLFSELLLFGHLSSILQNVDSVEIFKKHDNKHSYVHLSYFFSELYTFAEFGFHIILHLIALSGFFLFLKPFQNCFFFLNIFRLPPDLFASAHLLKEMHYQMTNTHIWLNIVIN